MACPTPVAEIDHTLADDRIKIFIDHKKASLEAAPPPHSERESIEYEANTFRQFLNFLVAGKFSGVRAYFASYRLTGADADDHFIPAGKNEQLAVVFVPTRNDGQDNHVDQLQSTILLEGSTFEFFDLTDPNASHAPLNWITHYQKDRIPKLEIDGSVNHPGFRESIYLWYTAKLIEGASGLLEYTDCMIREGMTTVKLAFAAYLPPETARVGMSLDFQLTQIFKLKLPNQLFDQSTFVTLSAIDIKEEQLAILVGDADTGKPCPPRCDAGAKLVIP